MSQPASPWTLQASIGGQPCSLDIVGDELVILRSKNEWFRVPLRLVLDAKLDEASTALSLSLLAARGSRAAGSTSFHKSAGATEIPTRKPCPLRCSTCTRT